MKRLTRRRFFVLSAAAMAGLSLTGPGCSSQSPSPTGGPAVPTPTGGPAVPTPTGGRAVPTPTGGQPYLSIAHGSDPAAITRAAIAALGGIERFVHPGNDVIIKPNMCVGYRTPEFAATTNPDVVAALVALCKGAGAKRVRVMDTPISGTPESAYTTSGIQEAVTTAGGEMEIMGSAKYAKTAIPDGRDIQEWEIYQPILDADVLINVPIAKHHSLARLTLGAKNLLGVARYPSLIHHDLGQRVADLLSVIRPTLTVMDAVRIMMTHGPTGGSLNDVRQTDMVIASHDTVAADAYTTTLFDMTGEDIAYVRAAADMGLGTMTLEGLKVEEVNA